MVDDVTFSLLCCAGIACLKTWRAASTSQRMCPVKRNIRLESALSVVVSLAGLWMESQNVVQQSNHNQAGS